MSAPPKWGQPARSEFFKPRDHIGELVAFQVIRYLEGYRTNLTKPGEEGAAEANVTMLTGPFAGEKWDGAIFNQTVLRAALKDAVGGWVLARIGQGTAKPGQSAAFLLIEHTKDDEAIANRYFTTGTADKTAPATTAEPEPVRTYTPPAAEPSRVVTPEANGDAAKARVAELERMLNEARQGAHAADPNTPPY